MTTPTKLPSPLRVAVIGSGPSGFYVVQSLLRDATFDIRVDLFDRLPTPYGLVRYGVAPDHLKIKNVTKVYAKIASDERVRFFGNVDFGRDVTIEDLRRHYHQIVYCSGAQTDRRLGIPGEDLAGSHPATEFVAWYNGHPDFRDCQFDFDCERAVVVGVGNVAVDVARILVRTQEELKRSDIAEHAMEALAESRIREVVVLGRRGPLQAAFTNKELEELGQMEDADTATVLDEVTLDALSAADLEAEPDRQLSAKAELLQDYARRTPGKSRRVVLRFLVSPTALVDDGAGRVGRVEIVRNELYRSGDGSLRPRATDRTESLDAGLVFRSVGYRGVPLPGVPFREDWGTIPEAEGRVLASPGGAAVEGEYCAGWVKRGPSGVIGTNRPDAQETVNAMLADARAGKTLAAEASGGEGVGALLAERGVVYVSFPEWQRIDDAEVARGEAEGRPRVKFTRRDAMMAARGAASRLR
jgi:ferredoxin--NADP+ reductase